MTSEELWGTSSLRRYYARQAVREALKSERGQGVYRFATSAERKRTAEHLREVAQFHRTAAKALGRTEAMESGGRGEGDQSASPG